MLLTLFESLRAEGLKVSPKEWLSFMEVLHSGMMEGDDGDGPSVDRFYQLARLSLVKDETRFDRFDRAFGLWVGRQMAATQSTDIPSEWLRKALEKRLSPEERAKLSAMPWDELMKALQDRLDTQKERHEGGSRWIGTGGTSPFGAYGDNPAGIRIGQEHSRMRSAVKVWDQRQFKDYDDRGALQTRQIQLALRRLRRFAREGAQEELDLDQTISATARQGGWLDLRTRPERKNRVKVLLLMDVGGSMDDHVQRVETLFSATRREFKHLEFFYFHNCVYESLWKSNIRRNSERTSTLDLIRTYPSDYRLIFVGDATMSPYEILHAGGSVESHNPEPGAEWVRRLTHAFPSHAWINPEPQASWSYRPSIDILRQLVDQRMYPLTLQGLEDAMHRLSR